MVFNQPLGGVACLSGHKLVETPFLNNINNETPVLIGLGLNDEALHYQDAYASYRIGSFLQKKPNITFHKIANSDHSMDQEVLEIVRDWIMGSCVDSSGSKKKLLGGAPSLLMIFRGLKQRSRRPQRVRALISRFLVGRIGSHSGSTQWIPAKAYRKKSSRIRKFDQWGTF
jgi:hypothetical protein